jgi:polyisoprenoid-binding protein YceI
MSVQANTPSYAEGLKKWQSAIFFPQSSEKEERNRAATAHIKQGEPMRNLILFSAVMLLASLGLAQSTSTWKYDLSHAKLSFSIAHFGISETEGKFSQFDGKVVSGKEDFTDALFEITIDVNSIDTDDARRDEHLKSPDFFDVKKYPSITFKSTKVTPTGKNTFKLTGDFSMHGVTKEISLDVLYKGTVVDPFNNTKAGFKISGIIDRTDFGLEWNGVLAAGGALLGDEVTLAINIELQKI